jgi:hypothetical protein
MKMTDFSHLHALEERAVRIRERMIDVQKNDAQWKAQAVQLFQTEKEIADEREFLGLEDMSTDDLYAGLIEEHESEVVREVTAIANAAEQAEQIRTAAEALMDAIENSKRTINHRTQVTDVYFEMEREYARMESVIASASKGQQSLRPRGSNGEYSQFQHECYAKYQSQIEKAQTRMRELKALAQETR